MAYDQAVGPREGRSAISAATRRRLFGNPQGGGYAPYERESETYNEGADFQDMLMQLFARMRGGGQMFSRGQQLSPEQRYALGQQQLELGRQELEAYSPRAQVEAARYLADPIGSAIQAREAANVNKGGLDWFERVNQIPKLTPAAKLASQNVRPSRRPGYGGSARSQWALRGGVQGINPEDYRRMLGFG